MGVHYLSDVIGGFLLAVLVGLFWLYFHEGALQLLLSALFVPLASAALVDNSLAAKPDPRFAGIFVI